MTFFAMLARLSGLARGLVLVLACLTVAACSQTAMSTYSGKIGQSGLSKEEIRKKKILAARARAKATRQAKREAFKKKLAGASKKVSNKKLAKKTKRSRKAKKTAYKKRKKSTRKTVLRKSAKAKVKRKTASKSRKLAKRKSAYVGSASRKAGKLRTRAPMGCVPKSLKKVIAQIRKRYGSVTINSTYRSRRHNRRIGGKRRSLHLHCRAVDFRVHGSTRGLTRWLARHPLVGGYKRYPSGYYHIDNGPKRTW